MIKFGLTDMKESMEYGKHAASLISAKFPKPVKLEFEKI